MTTKTLNDKTRQAIEAACSAVRETPIAGGRKVWDLLTDERSRQAVAIAERYVAGAATDEELAAAARDAVNAATQAGPLDVAAWLAAWAAADAADAARTAAAGRPYAAAYVARAAEWGAEIAAARAAQA